MSQSKIDIEK